MQTEFDGATIETVGNVAVVTFSRPPHNYFDLGLINVLAEAFEEIDRQDHLRAILLRSEGRVFCAGASFSGREGSGEGELADPGDLYRRGARLFRTKKPIVAAIQGAAVGGGLGLAMVADFRVASPEARFSANFTKIGIHPGFGLTWNLPRIVGPQVAHMMFYTGRRIDGETAVRLGLADELAPSDQLYDRALALAAEIAENAPLALEATRATLRRGMAEKIVEQTELECRIQIDLFASDDYKEGVNAVSERRPGNWTKT